MSDEEGQTKEDRRRKFKYILWLWAIVTVIVILGCRSVLAFYAFTTSDPEFYATGLESFPKHFVLVVVYIVFPFKILVLSALVVFPKTRNMIFEVNEWILKEKGTLIGGYFNLSLQGSSYFCGKDAKKEGEDKKGVSYVISIILFLLMVFASVTSPVGVAFMDVTLNPKHITEPFNSVLVVMPCIVAIVTLFLSVITIMNTCTVFMEKLSELDAESSLKYFRAMKSVASPVLLVVFASETALSIAFFFLWSKDPKDPWRIVIGVCILLSLLGLCAYTVVAEKTHEEFKGQSSRLK